MSTTAEWLTSLGMSEYAERFIENKIDISVLRHLTDQDLKDIGVLLGHRRKMLAAIGELAMWPRQPGQLASVLLLHWVNDTFQDGDVRKWHFQ